MKSKPRSFYVLLNPGPVNTSVQVKKALLRGDLCHRENEFSDLLLKVRHNLLKAFDIEKTHTAIFLTGSGTLALEASLVSGLDPQKKVLVLSNGVYGDRIDRIISLHGFRKEVLRVGFGNPFSLREIDQILLENPEIDTLAMVHHETSTGMLNPIHLVAQLKGMRGKRLILDSISALGGEALDFKSAKISLCAGTANKCIQGLPGVSFVLIEKAELERIKNFPPRSLYLDLNVYWKEQEKGGVPFTPSVHTFDALDAALEELLKEGVKKRIQRYQNYANRFRKGFEKLKLEYLIDPRDHSNTLTALKLPRNIAYSDLHDTLKKEGFIIYAGQDALQDQIFRVANMGNLRMGDINRFLKISGSFLNKRKGEAD